MKNIPLFKVFMSPETPDAVKEVLLSGWIGQAHKVEEFENLLRNHFQNNYINTLNSCTSGLHLALHVIKENSKCIKCQCKNEVLTTPLSCTATNFPILANDLKIKWVDVDPNTCNLDLDDLERKLSPNTKAIMVVHWGGYAVDIDRLKSIQNKCKEMYGYKPPIIEDCAHAWGAYYKNKLIGTHGNFSVFSFQAIKHITTGDGGIIISPDDITHKQCKLLRWYGLDRDSSADFRCEQDIKSPGFKFHMNDITAQIGICNLKHSIEIVAKHKENGFYYNNTLKNIPGLKLMENREDTDSSFWIYTVRVENRDNFMRKMKEQGITVSLVHKRNDLHSCLQEFKTALPSMDKLADEMICIPSGWWVSAEDREYIVDCIKKGW